MKRGDIKKSFAKKLARDESIPSSPFTSSIIPPEIVDDELNQTDVQKTITTPSFQQQLGQYLAVQQLEDGSSQSSSEDEEGSGDSRHQKLWNSSTGTTADSQSGIRQKGKRTIDSLLVEEKPSSKIRKTADLEKDVLSRTTGLHTPCIHRPKDGKDRRKRCRVCKARKTDLLCYECNVALCVNGFGMENCWYIFHNCESISKPALGSV